jgi:hypothetical protein
MSIQLGKYTIDDLCFNYDDEDDYDGGGDDDDSIMVMIMVGLLLSCGNETNGIKMELQQAMKKIIYDMILM